MAGETEEARLPGLPRGKRRLDRAALREELQDRAGARRAGRVAVPGHVLGALRDVADALAETAKRREEVDGQRRRVATSEEALRLTNQRFQAGVASYLEVLDALRSLYAARTDLTTAVAAREIGLVRLYQALGGGWTDESRSGAGASAGAPPREQGAASRGRP